MGSAIRGHWCDLPERYGRWKTVHRRFSRWCDAGVSERVFDALTADRDNQYLIIDSIVRVHQQAATVKGGSRPGAGAFPRRTDDQDPLADALGRQLRFFITAEQAMAPPLRQPCYKVNRLGPFPSIKRMTAMGYVRRLLR